MEMTRTLRRCCWWGNLAGGGRSGFSEVWGRHRVTGREGARGRGKDEPVSLLWVGGGRRLHCS